MMVLPGGAALAGPEKTHHRPDKLCASGFFFLLPAFQFK